MTLEGEYYTWNTSKNSTPYMVAILMTLEGEYYRFTQWFAATQKMVAILMTLEGEYYLQFLLHMGLLLQSRNPHDIGRRILLLG